MFAARFKKRGAGERALEAVHGGVDRGRQLVDRAMRQGRTAMDEAVSSGRGTMTGLLSPRQPEPSLWPWLLVGGLAGAAAMLVGQRARSASPWAARKVDDVMVREVETIEGSATLSQAAQRMRDANVGVLPLVEGGRLRGVLTDRDIVVRGVARGMDSGARVSECASRDLVAARPDWPVQQALDTMAMHQVGRLPVVDDAERVIGIVTLSSLALRSQRQDEALDTAKEVSRRSARAV